MNKRRITKIIIFVLVFLLVVSLVVFLYNLKNKNIVMERNIESYREYSNSIIPNENGFIVVGSSDHNSYKIEKASISQYDFDRNKILEKVYNKGYNSSFYDVIQDNEFYVAVGSYESTKKELENKTRTAFIVKYDKDFNIVFENDFQVVGDSNYYNIIKVLDGYVVCGDGVNPINKNGEIGATLIKYDFNGNEIFRKYIGSIGARYNGLLYLDNYIYACGIDYNKAFITKYDLYGNVIQVAHYENCEFTSIVNIDDRLYVSGIINNGNLTNGVVVSYDSFLNKVNEVIYNKYDNNKFNKLLVDKDSIIVIGDMYYKDTINLSDGIIGKYTKDLVEKSVIRYNGNRNIIFKDALFIDDKYIVIGHYNDNDTIISKIFVFSSSLKSLGA